jgi:hypothetical protein
MTHMENELITAAENLIRAINMSRTTEVGIWQSGDVDIYYNSADFSHAKNVLELILSRLIETEK